MAEYTPVAQLDRARVYEARCREFESPQECFQWQMSWNKVNQVRKWCKGRKLSVTRWLFFIEIQLLDFEDVLFAMDFLHFTLKTGTEIVGCYNKSIL